MQWVSDSSLFSRHLQGAQCRSVYSCYCLVSQMATPSPGYPVCTHPRGGRSWLTRESDKYSSILTSWDLFYRFTHPLTHSSTHPLTHSHTHSPTHPPTNSLTHPLTHSLTQPTHPLIHPLFLSLTEEVLQEVADCHIPGKLVTKLLEEK